MSMQNSVADILQALDAFIRKYYKNQLLRGLLCAVGIVATVFLAAVLLEHFGWLSRLGRGLLFWAGLAAVLCVVVRLVAVPLARMYGLGSRISRSEAARIVGRHFPEVDDRLVNLLQLAETDEKAGVAGSELLLAAIEQKSAQLRPVPLLKAIDLRRNRKYLKYALPPLAVIVSLLLVSPRTVTEPARRIANYTTVYERPAPFRFRVLNDPLAVRQGDDFELRVDVEGEAVPAEVDVVVDGRRYKATATVQEGRWLFVYRFAKPARTQRFVLEGGGVVSQEYTLEVLSNPAVRSFRMLLSYPAYTGREAETFDGLGDAAVPEGTLVRWLFQTQDADTLHFGDENGAWTANLGVDANGRCETSHRLMATTSYGFSVMRRADGRGNGPFVSDTLCYTLTAIADAAPQISVDEMTDSLHPDRLLFGGRIKDDYGFSRLVFAYRVENAADSSRNALNVAEMALQGSEPSQEFLFTFNLAELALMPGDRLSYWFEVSDNDAIHGPKTTQSRQFEVAVPTLDELDSLLERRSEEVQRSAEEQMSELRRMQEEVNELMQRLVDKKELSWQDRHDLEQLVAKQRQVHQMMQQMQQQIGENNRMEQRYREQSEQLMEKQRELDRLMNEVMDEKMKQTLAEMERLMNEVDKKKVQQQLEQIKLDNAELEQQLDQNIELMKRLELEKRVEQTVQDMDKLAAEQRNLSRETEQAKGKDKEQLVEKQKELNERFKQMQQSLDQIRQDYKELDPSVDFNVSKDLQQQIGREQSEATQRMQQGKSKDASSLQQQAADDMERLSEAVARAQVEAEQGQLAEDAEEIRRLLKNLVHLSMNQEALIGDLYSIYIQDPRYQTVIAGQNRVKDDFRAVDDSLRSIAKRQVQVASAITKNLADANANIARSLNGLLDMNQSFYGNSRNIQASRSMQYSMTAMNNLALVLAESLDQMQAQMRQNNQKMGNGQCKNPGKGQRPSANPGKGKGAAQTMRQLQQELNRQMEQLRKQLEEQGGNKSGRHQLGQGQQMSEELAKMAAQQEAIRRMMQQYGQELKEGSGGNAKLAREVDQLLRQMEQTETDLVNRTITRQTIQRQQQILTRLLEHERAEIQREREERRQSHEAGELYSQPSPAEMQKYMRQMKSAADQLHSVPPSLEEFYRRKVNDYFYH